MLSTCGKIFIFQISLSFSHGKGNKEWSDLTFTSKENNTNQDIQEQFKEKPSSHTYQTQPKEASNPGGGDVLHAQQDKQVFSPQDAEVRGHDAALSVYSGIKRFSR